MKQFAGDISVSSEKNQTRRRVFPKTAVVYSFAFFAILLTTLNFSWLLFSVDSGTLNTAMKLSIALSFIAAIFGMLNIMTYSLYDPTSERVNRIRIFILFNSIAVISLATINAYNELWFLFFENIAFFATGVYQYFQWFVWKKEDSKKFDFHVLNRFGKRNAFLGFAVGIIFLGSFFAVVSIWITSLAVGGNFNTLTTYQYIGGTIDGFAFTISIMASLLVARKSIESQILYFISDLVLITWWLFNAFGLPDGYTGGIAEVSALKLSALSLVVLFSFYMSTNVINYYNWQSL